MPIRKFSNWDSFNSLLFFGKQEKIYYNIHCGMCDYCPIVSSDGFHGYFFKQFMR